MSYTAPERLRPDHDLSEFDCNVESLNDWLKRRAYANEQSGASRTYVVCASTHPNSTCVVAYYCLATGAIAIAQAPGNVRRNMPDPIPVMVLGRLAVDQSHQGQGLGQALLRDAILRTLQASEIVGIRAILVQAIDETAGKFYERFGFIRAPMDATLWMLRLQDARASLESSG